jgi:hypothetical protein
MPEVLQLFPNKLTTSGHSKLLKKVRERADEACLPITDPSLYENQSRRGRKDLLSEEQKRHIVEIATSCRNNREKESWQAIADNDFEGLAPKISVSLFNNIMYEAGYSRRKQDGSQSSHPHKNDNATRGLSRTIPINTSTATT